ncbi:MAG: type II toxin-antitoxin system HicB family antitoxin [Xanthomonadales bacterium]|nr:type II toxin-antitoxin system HicB family antitoxin [Xanthomonadales bacterium]
MIDPHAYGIEVRRRNIDGDVMFEARIHELPDIAEYADTLEDAYALAVDAILSTADVLAQRGQTMPGPMVPADEWSGRVTLRVPKSLHRALASAADGEGCSLNQHIVNVLVYFTGFAHAERAAEAHWQAPVEPVMSSAKPRHLRLVASQEYSLQSEPTYAVG